jgi:asparagine synthase (glutamine-hydrolysing)
MCGINGLFRLAGAREPLDLRELAATSAAQAQRGPDGSGAWVADDGSVALGHRRLAILDLSPAGQQPMASACGRYRLVFNGEIYNFRALRAELEARGERFRSTSDSEVILALFARHGPAAFARLRGMFALALWDQVERTLTLARDPLGIKPLYGSLDGGVFAFASQVRALLAGGRLRPALEPAGLVGFLLWGSVPEPWTLHRGIHQLPAGHWLRIDADGVGPPQSFASDAARAAPDAADFAEAVEGSVAAHLVSDVPVAVFLSAGLDSGLIAALACRHLPEPPTTFTLATDLTAGGPLDEAPLAAEVARRFGTRHVERRLARSDFEPLWEQALAAMDQPSVDGFNTFVVTRLAHEAGLKVVLSGLGGDELFGSYPSFRDVPRWHNAAKQLARVPGLAAAWPALARRLLPGRPKLTGLLEHGRSLAGAYLLRRGLFLPAELPRLLGPELAAAGLAAYDPEADGEHALAATPTHPSAWWAVHRLETALYMRNQLLRDADWASMASSVEVRVPLADVWLEEQVRRLLPTSGPLPPWGSKAELVRRLAPELPAALFTRPKTGFYLPVAEWLTGRDRAHAAGERGRGSRGLALAVLRAQGHGEALRG